MSLEFFENTWKYYRRIHGLFQSEFQSKKQMAQPTLTNYESTNPVSTIFFSPIFVMILFRLLRKWICYRSKKTVLTNRDFFFLFNWVILVKKRIRSLNWWVRYKQCKRVSCMRQTKTDPDCLRYPFHGFLLWHNFSSNF